MRITKSKKVVLTHSAQPCHDPCPTLGTKFNVIVWLWPATKGPSNCSAAPPPAGVWRRMERKRQKLVGWDKGSLTEQQSEKQ